MPKKPAKRPAPRKPMQKELARTNRALRALTRERAERLRAEKESIRQSNILGAINRVFQETLTCETDEEVARACLVVAEELTGSAFGFIGELNEQGTHDTIALSDPGWEACRMPRSNAVVMLRDMKIRGIWGRTFKDERTVTVNDPGSHPDRTGTPEGHPPITCFLGVPLKWGGKTVGMIGLANKEGGYNPDDRLAVEALSVVFIEALYRKRADMGTVIANERLDYLLSSSSACIYAAKVSGDHGTTFISKSVQHITGYDPEEFTRNPGFWIEHVHPDDVQWVMEDAAQLFEAGTHAYEYRFRHKNGKYIWVRDEMRLVRDREGKPLETIGYWIDITERKRAEDALRESEGRFRGLFDRVFDAIVMINGMGQIVDVNEAACRLLGYSKEELLNLSIGDIHPEKEMKKIAAAIERVLRNGIDYMGETAFVDKDGKVIEVEAGGVTMKISGNMYTVGSFRDIRERKRMDKLKDDFVRTVSHELRTPLSITKEGMSIVLDEIAGKMTEQQKSVLTAANRNLDRLSRIIDDLLDISTIETGRISLRKEQVDLSELIRHVVSSFERKVNEKGLEIRLNIPACGISVQADPDRITQVLTNLVDNAVKFTGKGHIDISAVEKETEVECTVSDTGMGISKENLPKVFSKFQQFGRSAGAGIKGTGLGLSITKGIVELHKGTMRVESEPGQGTKFTFSLPRQ